jgi:transposase, IS30 family
MSYHHLTINERYHIRAYLSAGYQKKKIAKELNVSPSTITRELQRNSGPKSGIYFPIGADNYAKERRINQSQNANKKLDKNMQFYIKN